MAKTKKEVKEVEDFQKEIKKPSPPNSKELFYQAIKKEPEDLSEEEVRALIYRMAYLSDDERYKFRNLLVREDLTYEETERYRKLYPNSKFEKYFPVKNKVEEHYKLYFLNRSKE